METITLKELQDLLSISAAAKVLDVSPSTIYGIVGRGKLKAITVGNVLYFRRQDVEDYKAELEAYEHSKLQQYFERLENLITKLSNKELKSSNNVSKIKEVRAFQESTILKFITSCEYYADSGGYPTENLTRIEKIIPTSTLYKQYIEFCRNNTIKLFATRKVFSRILSSSFGFQLKKARAGGPPAQCIVAYKDKAINEGKEHTTIANNSVGSFLKHYGCFSNEEQAISKGVKIIGKILSLEDFYTQYIEFCRNNMVCLPVSRKVFTRRLNDTYGYNSTKAWLNGKTQNVITVYVAQDAPINK
jgi:excisionase family DNA binding protein